MILIRNKRLRLLHGAFESFSLLSAKLWLKNPAQARAFAGKVFRDYMTLAREDRWINRSLHELFPEAKSTRLVLEHLTGEGIYTPLDELASLAFITRQLAPSAIFEIGTFRGRTALNFALNAPTDCLVYTLDLPAEDRAQMQAQTNEADRAIIQASHTGIDYQGKEAAKNIRQLYGNSLTFDFSPYLGKIDLVFVDGAHHYEAVLKDTQTALSLVKPGGVILWHDFANYGDYNDVTRAVLRSLPPREIVQIENTQLAFYRKK